MKEYNFYASIVFLLIILAPSCNTTKVETEDCHKDRNTTETIKNQAGTILKMSDDLYLIAVDNSDNNTRYSPCNMADKWKVADKKVTFSGKVKEIYPNERWPGTPFVITECN